MAYLTNTSVNGDLGVSGLTSVGSAGLKFTSGIINIFGTTNSGGTGTDSISIGNGAAATGEKGIAIGYNSTTKTGTNIGAGSQNNSYLSLGVGGTKWVGANSSTSGWNSTSDKRDKTDFKTIETAIDFIMKLEPLTYVENLRENYFDEDGIFNEVDYKNCTKKKHRRLSGFIAQDVYAALKETYNTDNYAHIIDYNKNDNPDSNDIDRYYYNSSAMIPFLVKAIQEQNTKIEALEKEINQLKKYKE